MENVKPNRPPKRPLHYATVTEAINRLRQQGYTTDFNLAENGIRSEVAAYAAEDFEIKDIYRYEGNSDPAEEGRLCDHIV